MKTTVKVALTPEQRLEIEGAASLQGQTLAGYLRTAALEKSADLRRTNKRRVLPVVSQAPLNPEEAALFARWDAESSE